MPSLKAKMRITKGCLNNCWYCYVEKDRSLMSLETFMRITSFLERLFNKGIFTRIKVNLTGGDVTLNPYFLEFSTLLTSVFGKKLNIMAEIYSYCNEKLIEKFIDLGGICIVGLNEDKLKKPFKFAKLAKEKNQLGSLCVLLTPYNIERIDEILEKAITTDVNLRFNVLYDPKESELFKDKILEALHHIGQTFLEKKYKYYNYLFALLHLDKIRESYCGYKENLYVFEPNGEIKACPLEETICLVTDNNLEQRMRENFAYEYSSFRKTKCKGCDNYNFCLGGCPSSNRYGDYCKEYSTALLYMKLLKNEKSISKHLS